MKLLLLATNLSSLLKGFRVWYSLTYFFLFNCRYICCQLFFFTIKFAHTAPSTLKSESALQSCQKIQSHTPLAVHPLRISYSLLTKGIHLEKNTGGQNLIKLGSSRVGKCLRIAGNNLIIRAEWGRNASIFRKEVCQVMANRASMVLAEPCCTASFPDLMEFGNCFPRLRDCFFV